MSESILVVGSHPAVGRIAALPAAIYVSNLHLLERIRGQRFSFGCDINLVELGGVQPEDLRLVFLGDLLVAELLAHLVTDLEALERVDSPLRRSPPQTVRAPDHVVGAVVLDV